MFCIETKVLQLSRDEPWSFGYLRHNFLGCKCKPQCPSYHDCYINNGAIQVIIYKYSMNLDNNNNSTSQPSWNKVYQQTLAILIKNMINTTANKRKLIGEFILPLLISAIYALTQKYSSTEPLLAMILNVLLKIYIGLIGTSALRELVSLFITEKNDQFRQYQMIYGVSYKTHTLANLFYMKLYLSLTILPFFLTLNYYELYLPYILYFAAFVISSCYLTLAFTAFFKDQKVALEVIGLFYSLSSFLPFLYDYQHQGALLNYIIKIIPNSSFTIAIMNKNLSASLLSMSFVKLYILIFFIIQFRQIMVQKFKRCCHVIRQYIPAFSPQNNVLMEEFQLNEVVNQQQIMAENSRRVIIRTQSLSKSYSVNNHTLFALNQLSIKIYQSQIFGLLGRNGAGKTTLVDILTKITKPSHGSIEIAPINGIGICYQHQILYENLTVRQHLNLYSKLKIIEETEQHGIDEIIEMLKIQGEVDKKVKDLSGGNKRKLSIAIAILSKPQILIFDEPTSGLDPLSRTYIWQVISQLKRRKSTIILTTHHLDQAEILSDSICVIEKGKCIIENTAEYIKQKYGKGFHLKISPKVDTQTTLIHFEKYKQFLEQIKLKVFELDSTYNCLNLLVKPHPDLKNNNLQFQYAFQTFIIALEKEQHFTFKFHSNTLEESFIAILKDEDNSSGDSLADQNGYNLHSNSTSSSGIQKWLSQVIAIFLKNYYHKKSTLLQSLTLYNINIIVIATYYLFNGILKSNVEKIQPNEDTQANVPQNNSNSMMLLQGYIAMATAFITSPVYETQKKIQSVLCTRGLMRSCYWVGNFLFDYLAFLLNLLLVGYLVAPKSISEVGWAPMCWLGASMIIYAYCASNMFSKIKTASGWFSVINMIFGFIMMPMIIVSRINDNVKQFQFIKYFYPFYDLTFKSINANNALSSLPNQTSTSQDQPTVYFSLLFYIGLLVLIELHPIQRLMFYCKSNQEPANNQNTIQLNNVSKVYGSLTAIDNVSYSVNEERVALLGHNGAGKSTTFSLLTLQAQPTSGVYYISKKMALPYERVLESAGVCYQEDALWQQMIVEDIVSILKWMVPISDGQAEARWLFENLQFDVLNNFKRFSQLSGGNKRKLCLLFALFGNPELRLLDECSTGLDPSSRAAMVQTIKHSKKGSTLFTTHSMGQAEKVCGKAIIMSRGRIIEFQRIDRLVSKYFQCYWIDILLSSTHNSQSLSSNIPPQLKNAILITSSHRKLRLEVNILIKMSQIFDWICHMKETNIISSYSWAQPMLQDVYIKLTSQHQSQHQMLAP